MTRTIIPGDIPIPQLHGLLLGAISPRPIAFASTIDKQGNVNLSPFSFFNVFSANPPIMVFSPARRAKDNTTKHTLDNVEATRQVVINIVDHKMVQQMSLASSEYPREINEFIKAGFTEIPSITIKPPRVKESPVSFECQVNDIIHLGRQGGAGNLVICEVQLIHINEEILDNSNKIDPTKLDAVARMGGSWYCRANGDSIFEIPKPLASVGMGFDKIPKQIRSSGILTGNELGQLGNAETLPTKESIDNAKALQEVDEIISSNTKVEERLHQVAKGLLAKNEVDLAWGVLMCNK